MWDLDLLLTRVLRSLRQKRQSLSRLLRSKKKCQLRPARPIRSSRYLRRSRNLRLSKTSPIFQRKFPTQRKPCRCHSLPQSQASRLSPSLRPNQPRISAAPFALDPSLGPTAKNNLSSCLSSELCAKHNKKNTLHLMFLKRTSHVVSEALPLRKGPRSANAKTSLETVCSLRRSSGSKKRMRALCTSARPRIHQLRPRSPKHWLPESCWVETRV